MTGHVNDHKLAALQALLSISGGNVDDLEAAWLISEASNFGNPNDMWLQVFQDNGATADQFNTAASEFLIAAGYSGGIPQMWHDYWEAGGGTGGGTIVLDHFVDTDSVLLLNHAPDIDTVGNGWVNVFDTKVSEWDIQGNQARNGTGTQFQVVIDAGQADVITKCTLNIHDDSGLVANVVDSNNYWLAWLVPALGFRIFERTSGTFTQRDSVVRATLASTDVTTVTITTNGDDITCRFEVPVKGWDDTLSYSVASRPHKTNTRHGMRANDVTQTQRFDDFTVTQ